ncbi:MAG: hypothetical protein ACR2OC_07175 [Solirubrobacterales bacterium]
MIDERFRGPPDSANGGYACAMAARWLDGPAEVTLRAPPPLGERLHLQRREQVIALLDDDDLLIAEALPTTLQIDVPEPVSVDAARLAASRYPWRDQHPYPTCFVCGPLRDDGDGLRIFPGPVGDEPLFAAPWIPEPSLADAQGNVGVEFVWGALDCPSGIVTDLFGNVGLILLGRLAADLRHPVVAGLPYVVQAWPISRDGRKLNTASALFSAEGKLCAVGRAVWIELTSKD